MPIKIIETEKEGHRKVKTDFRKERLKKFKEKITGKNLQNFDVTMIKLKEEGPAKKHKSFDVSKPYESTKKKKTPYNQGLKGERTGKQFGGRTRLLEELGRVEGEPSNRNRRAEISRVHGELNRGYKKGGRAGYGLGTLVKGAKKIISQVKKPKGVFKPKPVPKGVTDKPTGWSPKGEYTKADDKKINTMLKKLGDEIKAQPLPPKTKDLVKKLQKAYGPHKKAAGGRIGLKHGGSAGAAKRGYGAEIK